MNGLSSSRVAKPYTSQSIDRNARIFGFTMLGLQIGFSLIYGFLFKVPPAQLNVSSVIVSIGLAILVIAGFGLLFGYTRRLSWSGIGFTFFITAFCVEVYPLINAFWTKTGLQTSNSPATDFSYSNRNYNLFLSDRETGLSGQKTFYGNSLTNSLKCALSVVVAFSSLLGRVGHLQCLFVAAFGSIGFELNRQVIQQNQGTDTFGTFYIFTFGGFMGLGMGLISLLRERKLTYRINLTSIRRFTGSQHSLLFAIFGSLIIFALFPLLAYQIDAYSRYNGYSPYTNPVCIIIGLGSGAVGAILTSNLLNGYILGRDAIHGPIAGAIVCGASSLYITNPVYAFIAGTIGGISQAFIQNFIQTFGIRKRLIVSSVSWSLFGIQGIIGAGFAAGWKAINFTYSKLTVEPATLHMTSQAQFYGGLISAGIGGTFGLGIGILIYLVNGQKSREYFEDLYYWYAYDGIQYDLIEDLTRPTTIIAKPVSSNPVRHEPEKVEGKKPEKAPSEAPLPIDYEDEEQQFDISIASEGIGNPYAYL